MSVPPTMLAKDGSINNLYQNFIALSRYARYLPEVMRRETWAETVDRYLDFMVDHLSARYVAPPESTVAQIREAILNLDVMPSMRALMTAGPALARSHIAAYNCSFVAVDHPRAFDESLYISMNGTGVGFSVESRHTQKLPAVPEFHNDNPTMIVVEDSKEGWAVAFRELLDALWSGTVPVWDTSKVRPAGSKLNTFGGRASGPAPLDELFRFTVDVFYRAEGRQLRPIEAHDIMCKVGDCVVSGGVRRSALISLSDLDDYDLAKAKSGNWWEKDGHRALANNSAVYNRKPKVTQFLREWRNLIESESGERGIFNLHGSQAKAYAAGRDGSQVQGVNPCGEILLRSLEFCNLTEVVIKPSDSVIDIERKVELATVLGTWQSTFTDFKYLRPKWRENCEDERLLGVSLTGIYGHQLFNNHNDPHLTPRLQNLRRVTHRTNAVEAERLGINPSLSVTTVKPSGSVSQLTGVSSGIHPWHSEHYIRTVRGNNNDPMTILLKDYEVPNEPDVTKPDMTTVFSFPIKAPTGAKTRADVSALDHIKLWSVYREHWTDHNPSVTISVREDEWMEVGNWVYTNWESVGGMSFLPYSDHSYAQAPYQPVSTDEYNKAVADMPEGIYWYDLSIYEGATDATVGSQSFACAADGCDIVDIGQS